MFRTVIYLIIVFALSISSCQIKEKMELLSQVEDNMESELKHPEIELAMNWGEKSYLTITFINYDFTGKSWEELESTTVKAKDFLIASDPSLHELQYLVIIFTDGDERNFHQKAEFRIDQKKF